MAGDRVTQQQLDELLVHLGFRRETVQQQWLRYEHAPSDTVIVLANKEPTEPARPSEVASARVHLLAKKLISEEEMERLFEKGSSGAVRSRSG